MTIDKIRLKKLAEAATQGPWCWDKGEDPRPHTYGIATHADPECMVVNQDFGIEMKEDAYFIAAASPTTVLALLAEIERLSPPAGQVSYQQQMEAWKSASSQDLRARGELMIQIEELEAENEALRKDAERYRWLRDEEFLHHWAQVHVCDEPRRAEITDAAIDAARAKEASHG